LKNNIRTRHTVITLLAFIYLSDTTRSPRPGEVDGKGKCFDRTLLKTSNVLVDNHPPPPPSYNAVADPRFSQRGVQYPGFFKGSSILVHFDPQQHHASQNHPGHIMMSNYDYQGKTLIYTKRQWQLIRSYWMCTSLRLKQQNIIKAEFFSET